MNEPDAEKVRTLVGREAGLTSSAWCRAEFASVLLRHVREKGLTPAQARTLHGFFRKDVREGVWSLVPVTADLLEDVEDRILRLRKRDLFLRAGDAVHLATAKREGFRTIWTSDQHLLRAAPRFGLRGRSV